MMYSNSKEIDKNISNNKKTKSVIAIIVACFIVSLLALIVFRYNITKVSKINADNYKITNTNDYVFSINNVIKENEKLTIEGYLYKNGVDIKIIATHMILKDNDGNYYKMPTYVKYQEELVGNNNYGWAGFVSILNTKKFNINDNYKLYMLSSINNEELLIDTNISLKEAIENVR